METKQTKGLTRNTIDKYYTKNDVVDLCLNLVKTHIQINSNDLIIEPSAGSGSFIPGIKLLTNNFRFIDLEPDNDEILKQDYLLYDYSSIQKTFCKIHIVGNPPFGRQSSLAMKFIRKSCEFGDSISFILPKSFKKDSLKKTFPLNFHLIFETDLPDKSFLVDGTEHNVPCIFQIWKKQTNKRSVSEKLEPVNFLFVKKTEKQLLIHPRNKVQRKHLKASNLQLGLETQDFQKLNKQTCHFFDKNKNSLYLFQLVAIVTTEKTLVGTSRAKANQPSVAIAIKLFTAVTYDFVIS